MTRHTPHRTPRQQLEPSHTQVQALRRPHRGTHILRRFAAGVAALALAATGALAVAPGTAAADSHRDGQWYLDDFNINKVHELSQGEGVTIGVIDSGIDAEHPDLHGSVLKGANFGPDGRTDKAANTDTEGHGTAVASVLAGHGHGKNNADGILGIAPKATVIPVTMDFEKSFSKDVFAESVKYLIEQDVNIISISLGGGAGMPETIEAIKKADDNGIAVVASAGNYETESYGQIVKSRATSWPASEQGVIPVTGTDQSGGSWEGTSYLKDAAKHPQLGLSAPGVDIPIAMPDSKYDVRAGTSFSAPIVAGTLALIRSAYPELPLYQLQARLLDTVDDKGKKGFDHKYGWGIVNPYKALTEETVYTNPHGLETVSSPKDRLPLEQQGEPVTNLEPERFKELTFDPVPEEVHESGPKTWLVVLVSLVAIYGVIILVGVITAIIVTIISAKKRRNKRRRAPQTRSDAPLAAAEHTAVPTRAQPPFVAPAPNNAAGQVAPCPWPPASGAENYQMKPPSSVWPPAGQPPANYSEPEQMPPGTQAADSAGRRPPQSPGSQPRQ